MRSVLAISCFILFACSSQAQDTLYRVDGTIQLVNIISMDGSKIKYRAHSTGDSIVYNLSTHTVLKVVAESGAVKTLNTLKSGALTASNAVDPRIKDFGRDLFSINLLDLKFNVLTLGYEHTAKNGKFSVKIPFSFGLSKTNSSFKHGYYNGNKSYSSGIDFYLYPNGQGSNRFYYGPSYEFGAGDVLIQSYSAGVNKTKSKFNALLLQCGVLFQPDKHINLALSAGAGYAWHDISHDGLYGNSYYYNPSQFVLRGGIHIGYKF
jgi:hypothetical protein